VAGHFGRSGHGKSAAAGGWLKCAALGIDDRGFVGRILVARGGQQFFVMAAEHECARGIERGKLVA